MQQWTTVQSMTTYRAREEDCWPSRSRTISLQTSDVEGGLWRWLLWTLSYHGRPKLGDTSCISTSNRQPFAAVSTKHFQTKPCIPTSRNAFRFWRQIRKLNCGHPLLRVVLRQISEFRPSLSFQKKSEFQLPLFTKHTSEFWISVIPLSPRQNSEFRSLHGSQSEI